MELKHLTIADVKVGITDNGILRGYASVFGNEDLGGDIVERGAFAKTLAENLPKSRIKLVDSHMVHQGSDAIIGLVTDAKEDDHGLWFEASFSSVPKAQEIRTKIKEGVLNALSFGYQVVKDSIDGNTGVRRLKELRLYEISVVPWGMNPKAAVASVKSAQVNRLSADFRKSLASYKSGLRAAGINIR